MGTVTTVVTPEYMPSSRTMKALVWLGPGDVRLVDAPIPNITQDDDVVLRVTGTTICGSDLHLLASSCDDAVYFCLRSWPDRYHGEIPAMQKGDIMGHEVNNFDTWLVRSFMTDGSKLV